MIEKTETLHLSKSGAEALFAVQEQSPPINEKLLHAAQRYRDTVNVDPGIDKNHLTGAEKLLLTSQPK